ncbi:hypothetical protein SVIOM74S_09757 [Streptomyces violarus]
MQRYVNAEDGCKSLTQLRALVPLSCKGWSVRPGGRRPSHRSGHRPPWAADHPRPSTNAEHHAAHSHEPRHQADSSCLSASRSRAARSATDAGPNAAARSAHRCPSASSPRRA